MEQGRPPRRRKGSAISDPPPAQANHREEGAFQSRGQHGSTIRAVTPESIPEDEAVSATFSGSSRIPSSPPVSPRGTVQRESPRSNSRALILRPSSNDGDYHLRNLRDSQTRPRTRTLDERSSRDRSPTTLFMKSRHRIGSVHSTGSAITYQGIGPIGETVTSIGHISTISPGSQTTIASTQPTTTSPRSPISARPRPTKLPPRNASPLPTSSIQPDSWVSPVPASDARKILQLMRSTCGRMQGILAFRRGPTSPWSLSYCYINDELGSLVYEPKSDRSYHRTLIPDLRGCQVKTAYDSETYTAYIHVCLPNSTLEVHLRPPTQEEYDSWFAALLCWQPIRPRGIQNKMAKPQAPAATERRLADSRRHSEVSLLKEAPIIKVGKMIFWDTNVSYSNAGVTKSSARSPGYKLQSYGSRRWRRVSCTLRENGELKLYSDSDVTLVSVVQLSQLSRCAVQRLDPSVLDNDFCIAIYPQYTSSSTSLSLLRPIFLSLESRIQYEVWVVLLRAFTIPQLYGPKQPSLITEELSSPQSFTSPALDMFRMERSLSVLIIEARLPPPANSKSTDSPPTNSRPTSSAQRHPGGYFAEILLDGEIRARTMLKDEVTNPFWREEFEFQDLPAVLSTCSLLLKKRPPSNPLAPSQPHDRGPRNEYGFGPEAFNSTESSGGYTGISFDHTCGKVDIYLDDLESCHEVEKWWPLVNMYGNTVGEILVKVRSEERVILMARDYQPMSELLHRFSNGLTLQVAQMIPNELKQLSECLLNIFQVSGQASEWIMALVEEEIDGTLKETPVSRLRYSRRLGSNDSNESFISSSDRELFLRDMGNNAKLEANLLFRGNTLLTKSLDLHMQRLGKEYLDDTLKEKLKEIVDKDPDCEVDPNRIQNQHELNSNWRRLLNLTEEMWKCIYNSASRCPAELRLILRHVRACADDRYGDFHRTVTYSSVSGFIFLRFFCPAILNPKLFGLLKDHPKPRARRTLTLIAKSLQGLANLSTFGAKEHWMEPMNAFLTSHRQEFKTFLDHICAIPTSGSGAPIAPIPPSYSTPLAILQRLPPTSREGFPSLPYLIDHARNFTALVTVWLEHSQAVAPNIQSTDGDLLKFHNLCVALQQRTQDCLARAERAERPSSSLSMKWEELVEQLENSTLSDPRNQRGRGREKEGEPDGDSLQLKLKPRHPIPSGLASQIRQGPQIVPQKPKQTQSISATYNSPSSTAGASGPSSATPTSSQYAPSVHSILSASASISASASEPDPTPPGSRGIGADDPSNGVRSLVSSLRSEEGPGAGSEDEYTTALPSMIGREGKDKRGGLRGVLSGAGLKKRRDRG